MEIPAKWEFPDKTVIAPDRRNLNLLSLEGESYGFAAEFPFSAVHFRSPSDDSARLDKGSSPGSRSDNAA
jgi:hypothetical protein